LDVFRRVHRDKFFKRHTAKTEPTAHELLHEVAGQPAVFYNDELFIQMREAFEVSPQFLGAANFNLQCLGDGGGKGGQLLGCTLDGRFVVKELNKADHDGLLKNSSLYVQHVLGSRGSMLVQMFAHFRQEDKNFIVMANLLPDVTHMDEVYDLKFCDDDKAVQHDQRPIKAVHRRWYKCPCCTCLDKQCASQQRQAYKAGKIRAAKVPFQMTPAQKKIVIEQINRDCDWLQQVGLMDYSLIVGIKMRPLRPHESAQPLGFEEDPSALTSGLRISQRQRSQGHLHMPVVCVIKDERDQLQVLEYYIGIIDFLQAWTTVKKIAWCVKFAEWNKATVNPSIYGPRFKARAQERIVPSAMALFSSRLGVVSDEEYAQEYLTIMEDGEVVGNQPLEMDKRLTFKTEGSIFDIGFCGGPRICSESEAVHHLYPPELTIDSLNLASSPVEKEGL